MTACRGVLAVLGLGLVWPASPAAAQTTYLNDSVRTFVSRHRPAILQEFVEFLAIPNLASDTVNIRKNASALVRMLQRRGLETQLLGAGDAPPVVLARSPADPTKHTVTFYAHYDGQPVNKADWAHDPWQPTLVNAGTPGAADSDDSATRLYARSSSDDKAAIIGLLTALDALRAAGEPPSVNLKFFFEGEEEAGSPHLHEILAAHADVLQSDLWVICDGPTNQNGQPQLVFGSRGVVSAQLTAFGPNRALHSGHYGNWAPNPIVELTHVLSRLRTTEGEVTIPHFYDAVRPPTASERDALESVPNVDARLKAELGLARTEGQGALAERIMKPGLNVDRIEGGGTGPNPANAIPSSATAYLDFRLVPDLTPELVKAQLERYLRELGYYVLDGPPTAGDRVAHGRLLQLVWGAGYPPQRTAIDSPVSQAFIRAIRTVTGRDLVLLPTLGGSTPSYLFEQHFRRPVIGLPIANYDNNQHAANENLKLENLWYGIALFAGAYGRLGDFWK